MRTFVTARARRHRVALLAMPRRQHVQVSWPRLERALVRADVNWAVGAVASVWAGGIVAMATLSWAVGGPTLAALGAGFAAVLPGAILRACRDRADVRLEAALGPALEAVARSVRSGAGLAQAVEEAATAAPALLAGDLRLLTGSVRRGMGFVEALERWPISRPLPGVRLAAAAIALAAESGGPPGQPLDGVASSLQERAALRRETRALASQARLSAAVIVVAPLAFALLAAGIDSTTARFLLTTPAGQLCLAVGVALDAIGALWMHRITKAVAR